MTQEFCTEAYQLIERLTQQMFESAASQSPIRQQRIEALLLKANKRYSRRYYAYTRNR